MKEKKVLNKKKIKFSVNELWADSKICLVRNFKLNKNS